MFSNNFSDPEVHEFSPIVLIILLWSKFVFSNNFSDPEVHEFAPIVLIALIPNSCLSMVSWGSRVNYELPLLHFGARLVHFGLQWVWLRWHLVRLRWPLIDFERQLGPSNSSLILSSCLLMVSLGSRINSGLQLLHFWAGLVHFGFQLERLRWHLIDFER